MGVAGKTIKIDRDPFLRGNDLLNWCRRTSRIDIMVSTIEHLATYVVRHDLRILLLNGPKLVCEILKSARLVRAATFPLTSLTVCARRSTRWDMLSERCTTKGGLRLVCEV